MENEYREAIELKLPSRLGLEKVAMSAAGELAYMMGFPEKRIEHLKTAVEEACMNAIEHGNRENARIKVLVELIAGDDKLQVDVRDGGKGIRNEVEEPDIDAKMKGKQSPRGWGLFLIKSLMDEVEFSWDPEKGNVTRMIIYLKQ